MAKPSSFLIEQPKLNEPCPCGSKITFGGCCGGENLCDCKSHLTAEECCYQIEDVQKQPARR